MQKKSKAQKRSPKEPVKETEYKKNEKSKTSLKAQRDEELLVYGVHACHALFRARKSDIVRVYCTEERLSGFKNLLRWCAENKKAYHIVEKEDVSRVTESLHHEGIAILAKRKKNLAEQDLLTLLKKAPQPLVVLAGVENPHNIGAIMRVMAHFGWKYLLYPEQKAVQISSSAARIGEGGSEFVNVSTFKDTDKFLQSLKALGYQTIGTSAHAPHSLYETKFQYPSCAIFLGSETSGLPPSLTKKLNKNISIPGAGQVQSLNVGIAAALFIGECVRHHGVISSI